MIPCCIFPSRFLDRRLGGQGADAPVASTTDLCRYVAERARAALATGSGPGNATVEFAALGFEGKDIVVFTRPA